MTKHMTYEEEEKALEEYRGFNQNDWDKLNHNLKTLIEHKRDISGRGEGLFKAIIEVLTEHEKKLKPEQNIHFVNAKKYIYQRLVKEWDKTKVEKEWMLYMDGYIDSLWDNELIEKEEANTLYKYVNTILKSKGGK